MNWFRLLLRGVSDGTRSTPDVHPYPITIARGRGYTTAIVGEANYQPALANIAGPKTEDGKNFAIAAHMVFDDANRHDPNAVAVKIDGKTVGFIARSEAPAIRLAILSLDPNLRRAKCYAKIVGGWRSPDGNDGHYGVKLSLSSPLRKE